MACQNILSQDIYEFIVKYEYNPIFGVEPVCIQPFNYVWQMAYYEGDNLPPLNPSNYSYFMIPKCYTMCCCPESQLQICDVSSREVMQQAGILQIQNLSSFELKGSGVIVGMIVPGIDFADPMFRYSDGTSRILGIWDQSRDGTPPEEFVYGSEYTKEMIDEALQSENPYELVPVTDEDGSGTFLTGLAAGGESENGNEIGAAPQAMIVVVKLKPAKQYLRDYYFIPEDASCYQENDIILATQYLLNTAKKWGMPLSICCPLGTNMGSHAGESFLSDILNQRTLTRGSAVTTAAGNEAYAQHHYSGEMDENTEYEDVEINVEDGVDGFVLELWAEETKLFSVSIISPSGEVVARAAPREGNHAEYQFVFEETTVEIDYRVTGGFVGYELIFMRFRKPAKGFWNVRVFKDTLGSGTYQMWLPVRQFLSGEVTFLRSNPKRTVTTPGMAMYPMTVGAYDMSTGGIYQNSGRGYSLSGAVKPDFTQPGVSVIARGRGGRLEARTGTSIAAAVNCGAAALMLEWGIVREKDLQMNSATIKNYFIRGCTQADSRNVPNDVWGYGKANLYQTFERLRG